MRTPFAWWLLPLSLVMACGDDEDGADAASTASGAGAASSSSAATGASSTTSSGGGGATSSTGTGGQVEFSLTSSGFMDGEMIPETHLCTAGGGTNTSPALAWTSGPAETKSYALVMRDLDYMNGFLHWVIWDIPASTTSLPEDVEQTHQPDAPAGAKQAPSPGGGFGYFGPCSPNSVNTYEFTIYAIPDATLPGLDQSSSIEEAEQAIVDAQIAAAAIAGES